MGESGDMEPISMLQLPIPRRNSTGELVPPTPRLALGGKGKVAARYLRASISSCHDLCKYGHRDSSDAEEIHHFRFRKSISNAVSSKESLKAADSEKKSLVRPRGLPARKPSSDKKNTTENEKVLPSAVATVDANDIEDIKRSIPSTDAESLDGSADSSPVTIFSRGESTDSEMDNPLSGTESPSVHDKHVEKDVFSELTREVEEVQEPRSPIKAVDCMLPEPREAETSVPKVNKLSVIPKMVKKDHPSVKTIAESVNLKFKRGTSSSLPALPKGGVIKKETPLVRRSSPSMKPPTSSGPILKEWKQTNPAAKLKSPPKPLNKPNMVPIVKSGSPSGLQRRFSATPLANTTGKLHWQSPKSSVSPPSRLSATLSVRYKSPSTSSTGLKATPMVTSKHTPYPPVKKAFVSVESFKPERKKMLEMPKPTPPRRIPAVQGLKPASIKFSSTKPVLKNVKKAKTGSGSETVQEKTIYVDEPKWSNASSGRTLRSHATRHSPSLSLSSLPSFSSHDSDDLLDVSDCAAKEGRREPDSSRNSKSHERRKKKTGTRHHQQEKESATPYKLKFRRGKVVNIQPEAAAAPTRLTFRRRKALGRSPSGKGVDPPHRTHRRRASVGSVEGVSPNTGAGNVVLRRQQEEAPRKEVQALLLNQVIEETASKLVETRKSKVKALVGAFETVISLQERKPIDV